MGHCATAGSVVLSALAAQLNSVLKAARTLALSLFHLLTSNKTC